MRYKIFKTNLFLLILFLILSTSNLAQRFSTDSYEYRDNLRINTKTQIAEVMYSTDKTVYSGTPEEIARQFLSINKATFGIDNIENLNFMEVIENPGGNHVGFIQTYDGIPVYGSVTVVSINDKNQIETVTNGSLPTKNFKNTSPNIDKEKAIEISKSHIKLNEEGRVSKPNCELNIYSDSDYNLHLVWKVNFNASDPDGSWQILVDAHTGDVLDCIDIRIYMEKDGKVFKPDPITKSQNLDLLDNEDTNYWPIKTYYSTVTLKYLNSPGNQLWGTYAISNDIQYPHDVPVAQSS